VNKKLAAALAAVVIIGGGATASLAVASAQTGSSSSTTPSTPTPSGRPDRGAAQKSALDPLVKDGTITQDQEDKVLGALSSAAPKGAGGMAGFGALLGQGEDVIAKALGITTDELKADLKNGQSIADIAKAKGVDTSTVVQAIVDAANAKLDQAVTDGKLTKDQADKIKANETQMITAMVNGKLPFGGKGMFSGKGPGGGHGGPPRSTTTTTN